MLSISANNIRHKTNYCGTCKPQDVNFSSGKIKSLNKDVISFKGVSESQQRYIKKEDIPQIVEILSKNLIELLRSRNVTPYVVQSLIDEITNGLPIEVECTDDSINSRYQAACVPLYNTNGDLLKANLRINFNKPCSSLIADITHEFTHGLQYFTKDLAHISHRISKDRVGISAYMNASINFENDSIFELNVNSIEKDLTTIKKLIKKCHGRLDAFNFIKPERIAQYDQILDNALSKNGITNRNLALEYFKINLEMEIQAYEQHIKTHKKFTNKDNYIALLVLKRYEELSVYLDELMTYLF